ncbi:putative L-type lectin-domain containing receptor kinase S.7 [Senna tora]|uniref:Putative L-type lectin-domain containing receptor kinase S.7 n=1 Tax=Senna tora TaxID=362788 RepID=A0A834U2Q1_9FABA|nr:putative L-type lectin-domain containing receptor kinase S.7 [Senna tora]
MEAQVDFAIPKPKQKNNFSEFKDFNPHPGLKESKLLDMKRPGFVNLLSPQEDKFGGPSFYRDDSIKGKTCASVRKRFFSEAAANAIKDCAPKRPRLRSLSHVVPIDLHFTLLSDSYFKNGVVGLTRSTVVPSSNAGAIIYNQPIPLFDLLSNTSLLIFLTNNNLGSAGEYFGLVNASGLTRNKFVAVEFLEGDANHVGLDLDSTMSIKTGDAILEEIDLKSGSLITAWIEYRSDKRNLNVSLSYSNFKNPIILKSIFIS